MGLVPVEVLDACDAIGVVALRTALELRVAVPSGGSALDPMQLLLEHGKVVEHRLDVTRIGEAVAPDLIQERLGVDAPGPLLWHPLLEANAGA